MEELGYADLGSAVADHEFEDLAVLGEEDMVLAESSLFDSEEESYDSHDDDWDEDLDF